MSTWTFFRKQTQYRLTSYFDISKNKNLKDETNINKVKAKVKDVIDDFL